MPFFTRYRLFCLVGYSETWNADQQLYLTYENDFVFYGDFDFRGRKKDTGYSKADREDPCRLTAMLY